MANGFDYINKLHTSGGTSFPEQRVGDSVKKTAEWYKKSCDYVIALGESMRDSEKLQNAMSILRGNIPEEFYRKTLNPFNAKDERFKAYPATMRNLDIMRDILRRYISEYIKSPHQFIVGSCNPELSLRKEALLAQELKKYAEAAFAKELEIAMQQAMQQKAEADMQAQQNGQPPTQDPKPEDVMPPIEEYIAQWEANYIDSEVKQGQELLRIIDSLTDSELLYANAYFNFIAFGECFDYRDVRASYGSNDFVKESVPLDEAFPISNGEFFVEDHDMFARRMRMSYNTVLEMFDKDLSAKELDWIRNIYNSLGNPSQRRYTYADYKRTFPELCYNIENNQLYSNDTAAVEGNPDLIDVWHAVWVGWSKIGILTYQDENGLISTMKVPGDFKLDKEAGHIDLYYDWERTVYESYRIGARDNAIYPIKARPICYSRGGKLPYNGITELINGFGKFSIVELVTPYQILRNILSYHREMMVAKNKMTILVAAKSLFGTEDFEVDKALYNMQANNALFYDDENDANSQKAANIRLLSAGLNGAINDMTALIDSLKAEARELVDMTPQRYGDINQYAGKGTTEAAVARGAMGSVIINYVFDKFRERSYNADMDYTKLAWVDGLDVSYMRDGSITQFSLDINSHIHADYIIKAKNDAIESDKLEKIRQVAFNLSQNGDASMAIKAIVSDNITQIEEAINQFEQIQREHEQQQQQVMQQVEQMKIEAKLQEIAAKGEQDRLNIQAQFYADSQLEYIKGANAESVAMSGANSGVANFNTAMSKLDVEKMKQQTEREKLKVDLYNKASDRQVKLKEIDTNYKIAKTNKNRYDK